MFQTTTRNPNRDQTIVDDVSCDDCETCPACSSHDDLCCGNDDGCLAEQPDICVSHDPRDNREGDPTLNGAFA